MWHNAIHAIFYPGLSVGKCATAQVIHGIEGTVTEKAVEFILRDIVTREIFASTVGKKFMAGFHEAFLSDF